MNAEATKPTAPDSHVGKSDLKIILIAQQKGGVGKTTLARMFSIFGSRQDLMAKRVLVIDFDTQASLSKLYLDMDPSDGVGTRPPLHPDYDPVADKETWVGVSSSADIFYDADVVPYPVRYPYDLPNCQILPAWKDRLKKVEEQDPSKLRDTVISRLFDFLSSDDVRSAYDMVVIDTGPKDSPLFRTALRAATHLVIPVTLERQCMDGLEEMIALWTLETRARPKTRPLVLAGLVINMFDARFSAHNGYLSQLTSSPAIAPLLCKEILPRRAAVTERDTKGARPSTLFDLTSKQAPIAETALSLCKDIFKKVFPEEAARINKLRPDRKFASIANAARDAALEETE